jgi:transcription termination factor NusB
LGLVTDTDVTNKNYQMLYKASLSDKTNIEYIIDIYEEELNEQLIEDFLNNRSNKRSILKTILVDKNENEDTDDSHTTPGSGDFYYKESKFFFLILR